MVVKVIVVVEMESSRAVHFANTGHQRRRGVAEAEEPSWSVIKRDIEAGVLEKWSKKL